jgi:hypothetical protein
MVGKEQGAALGIATTSVYSIETLGDYLAETIYNLSNLGKNEVQRVHSAQDIPIYHHFDDTELSRFKI